jgi:aryl-alcohol dehydrogenase-like predicted oxidoreductase
MLKGKLGRLEVDTIDLLYQHRPRCSRARSACKVPHRMEVQP